MNNTRIFYRPGATVNHKELRVNIYHTPFLQKPFIPFSWPSPNLILYHSYLCAHVFPLLESRLLEVRIHLSPPMDCSWVQKHKVDAIHVCGMNDWLTDWMNECMRWSNIDEGDQTLINSPIALTKHWAAKTNSKSILTEAVLWRFPVTHASHWKLGQGPGDSVLVPSPMLERGARERSATAMKWIREKFYVHWPLFCI